MLHMTETVIQRDGPREIRLVLPCFYADPENFRETDFQAAARMNRFYEQAAGLLYAYACSLDVPAVRHSLFLCTTAVSMDTPGALLPVRLDLLFRRRGDRFYPPLHRSLLHIWQDGTLRPVSKKAHAAYDFPSCFI